MKNASHIPLGLKAAVSAPVAGSFEKWNRVALWLFYGLALYLYAYPAIGTRLVDFPVYYQAGLKAVQLHTVYDVEGHFQFKYSPLFAWAFGQTFSRLPAEWSAILWQKLSITLYLAWIAYFVRWMKLPKGVGLLAGLLLIWNPLKLELQLGQLNIIPLWLMTFYLYGYAWKKPWRWIALALAVQIKLYALVFLLVPFREKDYRDCVGALLATALVPLAAHAWLTNLDFSLGEHRAWVASLTQSSHDLLAHKTNVGLLGMLMRLGHHLPVSPELWPLVAKIAWFATGLGFVWAFVRLRLPDLSLFWVVTVWNPLVWTYWVIFLLPLGLSFLKDARVGETDSPFRPGAGTWAALALCWIVFQAQHAEIFWRAPLGLAIIAFGFVTLRASFSQRSTAPGL